MEVFEVTVEFLSPVVIGNSASWTLDGICYGILEEMKDVGLTSLDPMTSVPLHCEDGLFHASAAIFGNEPRKEKVMIGGIRPVTDMQDATAFIEPGRAGYVNKVVTKRAAFKLNMSRYSEIGARTVSWIARGNPQAVEALIRNAGFLGALRKDGYGRVGDVTIDVDPDLDPLFHEGRVMRPIPETHAAARGFDSSMAKVVDSWRPRYSDAANQAVCYAPTPRA